MSAKKNASILSYFSKKPAPSPNAASPKLTPAVPKDKGDVQNNSLNKSQQEIEADELTKSCLEDDEDMEIVEPKLEKKKRKRIIMDDSSDEEETKSKTSTPNKKSKLSEVNGSFSFSTPKSSSKKVKDKENNSPPSASKKVLKDRLSMFASPASANKSKNNDSIAEESTQDMKTMSFPHLSFAFLDPAKVKDKSKKSPDDPDYNAGTLYVPDSFLREQTPAQRQWWEFKINHFDKVLFFKMGKFYELFHMDAVIAVERCGLLYMKKEMAHCGFPEVAFERYAQVLVDLGYKVARIEQTETPADLDVRVKKMSRPTKFDKVVRREICQITSTGTRITGSKDVNYLTAICAKKSLDDDQVSIGLCFVDTSMGKVHLSRFEDDKELSCLETLLAFYPPIEIVASRSSRDLMSNFLQKFSFINKSYVNFPDAGKTLKSLHDYYGDDKEKWPPAICENLDPSDNLGLTPLKSSQLVLSSFGAIIQYLSESLIDNHVLEQQQVVNIDPPLDIKRKIEDVNYVASNMILDNKTLKNLDVIPNPECPEAAVIFDYIFNDFYD